MQELTAILETIPAFSWWLLAGGCAAPFIGPGFQHTRQKYYRWQLDRRFASSGGILQDELNEFERKIGDDLAPLEIFPLLQSGVAAGLFAGGGAWFAEMHWDMWWEGGVICFFLVTLLYKAWRRINDPEELATDFAMGDMVIPKEAGLGLLAGIGFVGLMLLLITSL